MGGDLDEDVEAVVEQRGDRRGESNRLADVAAEIAGIDRCVGRQRPPQHGRIDRKRRSPGLDATESHESRRSASGSIWRLWKA